MGPGDDATGRRRDAVEGDVYAMDALRGESQPPSPGRAPRSAPALTTRQQRTQHAHAEHAQQAAAELLRPAAALAAGVCASCGPGGHGGGRLHDVGPSLYSSPPRSRQPCSSPPAVDSLMPWRWTVPMTPVGTASRAVWGRRHGSPACSTFSRVRDRHPSTKVRSKFRVHGLSGLRGETAQKVRDAKQVYASTMCELEGISNQVHNMRQKR